MAHTTPKARVTQMAIDPKDRPSYSTEELQLYFKRIKLPQKYLDSAVLIDPSLAQTNKHGLPFILALTRYHTCNIPFENLELHYSTHKTISLDMSDLYTKFAKCGIQYGRGGRCMENNGFFSTVLRSLGFDVRNCAGRVSRVWVPGTSEDQHDTYDGWNHMLNLVRFDGEWYLVDVGMGAMGPNIPCPLQDGYETVSVAPRKIRLQLRAIPEHAAQREEDAPKLWCYDVCKHPVGNPSEDKWIPTYCFTETEFLPQDYEIMSWFTSSNPKSFFTWCMLCTKMVMDEAGEKIIGDVTLFNDGFRKTVGGKYEVAAKFKTEQDRIDALKRIFDIEFTEEERTGIGARMKLGQQANGI